MATINDINNEITRIDNAKRGIAEAIEEKGVQVPEESRIEEYPGLVRQIQNGSPDAVLYTPQELTPEQKQQARMNIGATAPEVFWAEYGVATYQQINDAINAKKLVLVLYGASVYVLTAIQASSIVFSCAQSFYLYRVSVNNNDVWSSNSYTMEVTANRVNTISGNETATDKYPSAKAVYDAVNPAIESIQPAGGMLPNVLYNFGQLSNNIAFLLGTISDASIVNHFYWIFETGSSVPTITWPAGLSWFGGSAPQIAANKHYEISVLNGVGVAMEV